MLREPPNDLKKLPPKSAGLAFRLGRGVRRFLLILCFLVWGVHIGHNNIREVERGKLWRSITEGWTPTEKRRVKVFLYWQALVSRVMSTHLLWWMYGVQSTHTYELRVYGRYGQGQEALYRDLYLPYPLRRYFLTYREAPAKGFYPPQTVSRIPVSGAVTSELVPDVPLPVLALHPLVPYPRWDPFRPKYTDNLLGNPAALEAYVWGFARRYPTYEGLALEAVYVDVWRQDIFPRSEALATGVLMAGELYQSRAFELKIPKGAL